MEDLTEVLFLKKYLIKEEEYDTLKEKYEKYIPKNFLELVNLGFLIYIGKHPTKGWFIFSERGPCIIWTEWNNRSIDYNYQMKILDNSSTILNINTCPKVMICKNHLCFFRKRDVFGRSSWAAAYGTFHGERNYMDDLSDDIDNRIGKENIFPTWKSGSGTNCLNIYCENFKL